LEVSILDLDVTIIVFKMVLSLYEGFYDGVGIADILDICLCTIIYSDEVLFLLQYILTGLESSLIHGCEIWSLIFNKMKSVGI
jgi:hypothetical protein